MNVPRPASEHAREALEARVKAYVWNEDLRRDILAALSGLREALAEARKDVVAITFDGWDSTRRRRGQRAVVKIDTALDRPVHDPIDDRADELLDGCIVALQDFDTEMLHAIADRREEINPGGWMQKMIWGYIEVWR